MPLPSLNGYDPKLTTMDKLLKHNPLDITAMLLWWIEEELLSKSGTPISQELSQLSTLLRMRTNDKVQDGLRSHFI
jgi:hypothetical protein